MGGLAKEVPIMKKIRWRKLIALALSILMVASTFTEWMPTALAVGEASQTAETGPSGAGEGAAGDAEGGSGADGGSAEGDTETPSGPPAKQLDFQDPDNGRPNLYVDFLGDNMKYLAPGRTASAGQLTQAPAAYDQSKQSNPTGTGNTWAGYKPGEETNGTDTIFWVGVGIDRTEVWKLLEGDQGALGLTSFEVGFYYNNVFIEPYTGADNDYARTLAHWNIAGPGETVDDKAKWSDVYKIVHAETDLDVQMDPVTQETLKEPSLDAIRLNSYHDDGSVGENDQRPDWKMTYVSLELKDDPHAVTALKRLANKYDPPADDADGDPTVVDAASGDNGPVYLLYIPFRLKKHDGMERLCLRLARNATHFSIGVGTDNTQYAAWERTTVRNPGKDLKLLTRFTGDLNIFTGDKADKDKEVSYSARLNFLNGGGAENTAILSVLQDPAATPVWVDGGRNGSVITGLQGGTGMQVKLNIQEGYTAKVWVVYTEGVDEGQPIEHPWTCTTVTEQEEYTFVMPEHNAIVYVQVEGGLSDYNLYLSEIPKPYSATYREGNETTITAGEVTINSFDPRVKHPDDGHGEGPKKRVSANTPVSIYVDTHSDYQAKVRIFNFKTGAYLTSGISVNGTEATIDANGVAVLPFGGTVTFTMAQTDADVVVEYTKGDTKSVKLEVWHEGKAAQQVKDVNIAQLAYTIFDDASMPALAYSGQVYEKVETTTDGDGGETTHRYHDAVKDPSEKTPWVPRSAATISGSLGGDAGRKGTPWAVPGTGGEANKAEGVSALMSILSASITTEANLASKLNALSLSTAVLYEDAGGDLTGLRKDLSGTPYGDGDLQEAAKLLWELRTKVEKDSALKAAYWKSVPNSPTDSTTAYTYLDLTPAQVQAYHLALLELDGVHQKNVDAYRQAYTLYQKELALWEPTQDSEITKGASAPIVPIKPNLTSSVWDPTTGVRSYQDSAYVDTYIANYTKYIERYHTYITSLSDDQAILTYDAFDGGTAPCPTAVPASVTVPLLTAADAEQAVRDAAVKYGWTDPTVPAEPTPGHTIVTRSGRQVSILLQADSAYEVESVELLNDKGNPLTNATQPVQSPSYQNVYTFTVPSENCLVRVHYALRNTRTVKLVVQGAGGQMDNLATVHAYQVSDPAKVTPTYATVTNDGHQGETTYNAEIARVPVYSYVNMEVGVDDEYEVTVSVTNGPGGPTVSCDGDESAGTYSFRNPSGDSDNPVVITVTYTPKGATYHQAHIRIKQLGGSSSSSNGAKWVENNSTDTQAVKGEVLDAIIHLAPGYYIDSSYAYGASGGYPFTLTGNGYDNGLGCLTSSGREEKKLTVTMPNEDLWVYIIVRKGLPPADPANTLSLIVKDEANTGSSFVDNWVKATVYNKEDDSQRAALDPIGKGTTGKGVTEYHYDQGDAAAGTAILAGDRVVIDLNAVTASGYYVAKVEVEPSYLGIAQQWQPTDIENDGRQLSFTMPAGSVTVTVTFGKADQDVGFPTYFVYAQKVEIGRDNQPVTTPVADNRITKMDSDTIFSFAQGSYIIPDDSPNPVKVPNILGSEGKGAGREGEEITMTFQVAKGWYVQSVVALTDGTAKDTPFEIIAGTGNNDGGGGQFTAKLVMPAGDAWFTVNYRQCPEDPDDPGGFIPRPIPSEYGVTLRILDEDNKAVPKDSNSVTATFANSLNAHTNTHKPITVTAEADIATQYIHAGDHVNLSWVLAEGYTLSYILVSPTALGIHPTYTEAGKTGFTMPASDITVVARVVKDAPRRYQANLTLRPPEGMSTADMGKVGQGTFVHGGAGSLTDYPANAIYSLLLDAGERVDMDLFAFDGYYIDRVTIEPASGASASLTGAFGSQQSSFVMPATDVNVNVWFKKGWPDTTRYDLTLKVYDPASDPANYAYFQSADGTAFTAPDNDHVSGGQVKTLTSKVLDGGEVVVAVNQGAEYFYDSSSVHITDSAGNAISWRAVAGGLAFPMPPRATTVEITFLNRKDETRDLRKATLEVVGNENGSAVVNLRRGSETPILSGTLGGLKVNDVLTLTTDLTGSNPKKQIMVAYAVDTATGQQLLVPMGAAVDGYNATTSQIAIPAGPADKPIKVYVKLADKTGGDSTDPAMRLLVSGPENSGSAELFQKDKPTNTTGAVPAGGGDAIRCVQGKELTVTMTPAEGYEIKRVTATNGRGEKVDYEWVSLYQDPNFDPIRWNQDEGWLHSTQRQITLTMPADGGTVTVEYAKIPTPPDPDDPPIQYTAQVVVNNEAAGNKVTTNDAKLWNTTLAGTTQPDLQRELTSEAGKWVNLQITVQAGYRIRPVVVVPQSYGIQPQLYLGDLDSQTTGFIMPAGDVTVYVTFVKDELQPFNATLVVTGPTGEKLADGKGVNRASITSLRTGTKGPLDGKTNPQSVQAVPVREWVMVDYTWDDTNYYPKSVTVRDQAGRDVPFTQVNANYIELPMVSRNITITITYADKTVDPPPTPPEPIPPDDPIPDPEPLGCPVILHVIDASTGKDITTEAQGYGMLTYVIDADTDPVNFITTGKITPLPIEEGESDETWGNMYGLKVPAGKMVTVTAYSNKEENIYIQSAYVLYREGGQMISCNLTHNHKDEGSTETDEGFYDERTDEFEVHLGRNDVYVYLTRKDPGKPDDPDDPDDPKNDRYTATLMLKGDASDMASTAAIFVGDDIQATDRKASVTVNGSHGKVDAARKETVKVVVTPQEGYDIDYVLVTPLGVPIDPYRVEHTLTFTMPGYNVSICVYLKRSSAKDYTATIHYSQQKLKDDSPNGQNSASITYTPDGQDPQTAKADLAQPTASISVKEGSTVTLDVTLDNPYTVLAAYVLQSGRLVPLAPALEGTVETESFIDNDLADGTATFTMPSGNVDVYVVTTDSPPEGEWHTAVLTVQDPQNSGDNSATIRRDNTIDGTANALPDPSSQNVNSAIPNQDFISVREGQVVTIEVKAAATGYIFDWPATLTHSEAYTETLHPVATTSSYYVYNFTTGNCNSAVLANFKNAVAKENPLTVVIEDPDNPGIVGDGQVENKVNVSVTDSEGKPDLTVTSISPSGAFQVIPDVEERSTITVTAIAAPGYKAYAHFANGDEEPPALALTESGTDANGNTLYIGEATMPGAPAQVTVTFYKTYTATLVLEDRNTADQATQATMYADFPVATNFPEPGTGYIKTFGPVLVNQTMDPARRSIPDLSRDTKLRVQVSPESVSKIIAVLRTDATGTTLIQNYEEKTNPDTNVTTFLYESTMGRSDVTITVIVDRKEADPEEPDKKPSYIASVATVGLPEGMGTPAIDVAPRPNPYRSGQVWTVADEGGILTVTAPAPQGYSITKATMKAVGGTDMPITFTKQAAETPGEFIFKWTADDTQKMPAANVMIEIFYTKEPTLTLQVREPAEIAGQNATKTVVSKDDGGWKPLLLKDGDTDSVEKDTPLQIEGSADMAPVPIDPDDSTKGNYKPYVKEVILQSEAGVTTLYQDKKTYQTSLTLTTLPSGETLTMPDSDTTVTVIYGVQPLSDPGGDPPPQPKPEVYTAWVTVVGDDGMPENKVTDISNISDPGAYPAASPKWACGVAETEDHPSIMRLTLTTKADYTAVVTAWGRVDTDLFVPVIQQGYTGAGTAEFHMPAQDVLVTVTYYGPDDTPPTASLEDVTLVLVHHGNQKGNNAIATGSNLEHLLTTDGETGTKLVEGDPLSPAYIQQTDKVENGAELRLSANWASGYKIVKATLSVPKTASGDQADLSAVDPATLDPDNGNYVASELPLNRYATNAAARFNMPGQNAIITVYYESIYTVTLNVQGTEHENNGDVINTTDNRANTVTSTGSTPIHHTGERLLEMRGGETVQTDAKPGDTSPNRLVGVVWESDLTGAQGTAAPTVPSYDFTMPEANVNLYAVFEKKPDDPKDYSYIAKVALHPDSEPYGDGNTVEIKNKTNGDAKHGVFWTAAQADDTVEVTVNLKDGYQAVVTSAYKDNAHTGAPADGTFDYYVTRTRFVISGKTTTFQMPAGTDATVTVKFVKGYDFTLTMTDKTKITAHAAAVALTKAAESGTVNPANLAAQWKDDPSGVVAGTPDVSEATVGEDNTTASATVPGLESGLTADTTLTLGTDDKSQIRVTRYTPFTGTQFVTQTGGKYTFETPAENVTESVLFKDEHAADNLLAKVQLRGDSDINGNTAKPIIDWTDQEDTGTKQTTQGEVWTTTDGGNTIDLSLTVARGYQAKIKVVRDDSMTNADGTLKDEANWVYLDAKTAGFTVDKGVTGDEMVYDQDGVTEIIVGFKANDADTVLGNDIGKTRHFRFNMPTEIPAQGTEDEEDYVPAVPETDVTVIVEFEYAGNIPAPHDPRNDADKTPAFLDQGFIYAESRGDYAVVEVPTLIKDEKLYDTDNYDEPVGEAAKDKAKDVRFKFYILNHDSGTYLELEQGKDIVLEPYDPDTLLTKDDPDTTDVNEADPYNYMEGMYTEKTTVDGVETERKYIGSKFIVRLLPQTSTSSAQYKAFQKMLDSDGSVRNISKEEGKTDYQTSLYILAQDAAKNQSSYTQVWVRPCVTLAGRVISYGPRHPLSAELFTMREPSKELKEDADYMADYVLATTSYTFDKEAAFTDEIEPVTWGTDKWQQVIRVRSSELLGGYDKNYDPDPAKFLDNYQDPTYAMVLKKAANLTYTRLDLHLNSAASNLVYNPDNHTYAIQDIITLVAGDIDEDGAVKWQDQDMLMNYLFRNAKWSRRTERPTLASDADQAALDAYKKALSEWDVSVHNPDSIPYRCDLDGDGTLSVADWNVMLNRGNYNHVVADYNWIEPVVGGRDAGTMSVLPHGLGTVKDGDQPVLLSLEDATLWTDCPAPFDPVWDVPLTEEELAILGDSIYDPDAFAEPTAPAKPAEPLTPEEAPQEDLLQPELPTGEELPHQDPALLPEDPTEP